MNTTLLGWVEVGGWQQPQYAFDMLLMSAEGVWESSFFLMVSNVSARMQMGGCLKFRLGYNLLYITYQSYRI